MYIRPVNGEKVDGFQSLRPDAVGQMSCTTTPTLVSLSGFMTGRPVDAENGIDVAVWVGRDDLAALTVHHVEMTIAVRMHQHLARLAIHIHVDQNLLVDSVVVVLVMRVILQRPFGGAGIGITREQRRGPFVVAWTLLLVPRTRIGGAVIDQVEVRIVSDPSPHRSSSGPPGVAGQVVTPRSAPLSEG